MSARLDGLKVFVRTFGCQMNENDSEHIVGVLAAAGAAPAGGPEDADIVIVNTCAVRQKSEEKLYSYLGRLARLRRKRPFLIGVAGCVAQVRGADLAARVPAVDLVIGPDNYLDLPEIIGRAAEAPVVRTDFGRDWREIGPEATARVTPASAFIPVMEGCDNFCAYCIVPYSRGREKFRPLGNVLAEVRSAVAAGGVEVQLLGQNVNSYRDPGSGLGLAGLLEAVAAVPGVEWIRFITSHPKNFGDDIIRVMAACPKICPALHLPVQSGSSRVLARMNRGYDREAYLALVGRLRRAVPDLLLMTDIIVGFPGETEEDFEATCGLLREVGYAGVFSFRYSPRPLTAAAAGPDDVPLEVKRRRLIALQSLQRSLQTGLLRSFVGRELRVLGSGPSPRGGGRFAGRTAGNLVVNFEAPADPSGRFVTVRVGGSGPYSLHGRAVG
ncbi:MAG TPA: tRNA (N6-isopentenyl adenosine(37)-C2)-methylthiotransferase MiaB [Candidatus Aminicenantes bacterium]|nr:tRNA (N6-isopentenyl adenosine(37)-C2)-methylthiotransferase MiaB [Candidatus Aminicenantes bacterium]HRY66295.1 tRNA (N6-isopentenyl adenosine(37)-C2)-methylthiotransferase MiaB [Candidatus Aminicenantes bacterium]HRZ73185.1 tRNA (N6-isopentenyl adenosine(37)-C2)-methylthiotransferase MiaB [Candidatus Aminicenantes bacterium]